MYRRLDKVAESLLRLFPEPKTSGTLDGGKPTVKLVKLQGLGNLTMLLPWALALQKANPDWDIELLTLTENLPFLNLVAPDLKTRGLDISPGGTLSLLKSWRFQKPDLVIDLEPYAKAVPLLAKLTGTKNFLSLKSLDWGNTAGPTTEDSPTTQENSRHLFQRFSTLLSHACGRELSPSPLTLPFHADAWPRASGPKFLIHPGTGPNAPQRRWPVSYFAWVIQQLVEQDQAAITLAGGVLDKPQVEEVLALLDPEVRSKVFVLCPSPLETLISQTAGADVVLSGDSFPVHLASLLGTAVVGLYGPNTPAHAGPWGSNSLALHHRLPCQPCMRVENRHFTDCQDNKCMQLLRPNEVLAALRQVVSQVG